MKNPLQTAYHEAGHAAACLRLGIRFQYVTVKIDEDSDSAGNCCTEDVNDGRLGSALKLAIVCHAGVAAESIPFFLVDPHLTKSGGRYDFEAARSILTRVGLSGAKLEKYNDYAIDHAYGLFDNQATWRIVERLANALVEKETLSFPEALDLAIEAAAKK